MDLVFVAADRFLSSPAPPLGGAGRGVRRERRRGVFLLNSGINCGMTIITRGKKQKQCDLLVIQRCAVGCRRCRNPSDGQLPRVVLVLALRLVTRESRQSKTFFRPVNFFLETPNPYRHRSCKSHTNPAIFNMGVAKKTRKFAAVRMLPA